jgi:hypothetical protein
MLYLNILFRFEPLVAKDYCRYKPVSIQAYGVKWNYSDVSLEPIVNIDSSADDTNGTEAKASDLKKENETFSRKLTTWLNMSSNNDSKISSNSENSNSSPSRNNTPIESMSSHLINFFYKIISIGIFHFSFSFKSSLGLYFER